MTSFPSAARYLAITRDISPAIAQCELTHIERTPIDLDLARTQHARYEVALREVGCEVMRLPAGASMPDSVFVEDTAVVLDELAIITRPGAASRRVETSAVATALRSHRPIAAILSPGTLDGGDVQRIGRTLYVGVGYRSNEAGITQLRALVSSHGYTVKPVVFSGCLHLKTAMSLVADGLVLLNPDWVDGGVFEGCRAIHVDPGEPLAANALLLDDAVIYPAEHVRTLSRIEDVGVSARTVPASELAKAEGGVTCCSLVLRKT